MHSDRESRFWAKVSKAGKNDCWNWIGAKRGQRQKRGCFWDGIKNTDAARWLWQHLHGPIGTGLVVIHSCDNPLCVNPSHIRLGTQGENVADMWAKGRANLIGIRAGAAKGRETLATRPDLRARGERHGIHKRNQKGENNPQASLTESDVREIRALGGSMSQRALASKFGVHQGVVWRVLKRKTWAHI